MRKAVTILQQHTLQNINLMRNSLSLNVIIVFISFFTTITKCFAQKTNEQIIAVKNVNVIKMTSPNQITENATVIIKGNKIEAINGIIDKNAKIIDAKNKWLIPGLIDMHVHLPNDFSIVNTFPTASADIHFDVQDLMTPFIANGVTTVFNLNSNAESYHQRKEIQFGNLIGPRIALAFLIDGGNGNGFVANTPEEGRQTVRIAKKEGYDFIKLYSGLNQKTYNAVIDEAYKQGMKTVGHIPNVFQNEIKNAFISHFDLVAHAEEFSKSAKEFDYDEALRFAKMAKDNNTWVSPTLTAMDWIASQTHSLDRLKSSQTVKYVHPLLQSKWLTANSYYSNSTPQRIEYFKQLRAFQALLVRALKELGVPVLAGTDAGLSGVVSGFSLHDELQLLVDAGLTPEEALYSATLLPSIWLGLQTQIGTIEEEKIADLILLSENPLTDIANTQKIDGVFVNGQWIEQKSIKMMLDDLSKRNSALKNQFDWNKTMKK